MSLIVWWCLLLVCCSTNWGEGGRVFFEILNLVLKVCFVSIVTHDMCGMTGMDSAPNVLEIDAGPPAI